jgi:methionyl-tRNA synthetase
LEAKMTSTMRQTLDTINAEIEELKARLDERETVKPKAKAPAKKKGRTIECDTCGVTVKSATWNQKRCAECAEKKREEYAEKSALYAKRREANGKLSAWLQEKGLPVRGMVWEAAVNGERNVRALRKLADEQKAAAGEPVKVEPEVEVMVALSDFDEEKVATLKAAGFSDEDIASLLA